MLSNPQTTREPTAIVEVESSSDGSSISERPKGLEDVNEKKLKARSCQGDDNDGVMVELGGPPTKRPATNKARAVADAINIGYERMLEGEEMKTPSLMEESPQVPVKRPKIHTMVIATPKGKE